jgi:hypothetical protein
MPRLLPALSCPQILDLLTKNAHLNDHSAGVNTGIVADRIQPLEPGIMATYELLLIIRKAPIHS